MRKKRPKHSKTQQKVEKSKKLKKKRPNTHQNAFRHKNKFKKARNGRKTTKVHRNVQLYTTQNPCVFLRVVQLLPHRILMFSKGWCSSYPTLCFDKGGVAVTKQNPCIFPRVVQVLPHRILVFSSEWYTAFAARAAFSLRQKLCPPQVFTRILVPFHQKILEH